MPKCCSCGNNIIGVVYEHDGKKYCYNCHQTIEQKINELEQQKQNLFIYIKKIFNIAELSFDVVNALEKEIKSGKTISGIQKTIWYYYQILGKEADNIDYLIYNVREQYQNARTYILENQKIQEYNKNIDLYVPSVHIVLDPRKMRNNKRAHKKVTNIEDL